MEWMLFEPCCGSAALTLHLLGARQQVLPYQGSKWKLRRRLAALVRACGLKGAPGVVELSDIGPWGTTMGVLLDPKRRQLLCSTLRHKMLHRDPVQLFKEIDGDLCPKHPVLFAAEHLILQRLAYAGKAVGSGTGRWKAPGYSESSAHGRPGTARFGEVKPMLPALLRAIEALGALSLPDPERVVVRRGPIREPDFTADDVDERPWLVYIDPPYEDTTAYPDGQLGRKELVRLASLWAGAGAFVFVSEAQPIPELVERGWRSVQLAGPRDVSQAFRSKKTEHVTFSCADFQEDVWNHYLSRSART